MALKPSYTGQESKISKALDELQDAVFRADDAGIEKIVLQVIYSILDKVSISASELDEYIFDYSKYDILYVNDFASCYNDLNNYLISKYRAYLDNYSPREIAFKAIVKALSNLRNVCQKKIEERFDYFKLGRSYDLNKREFVDSLSRDIIERLELVGFDANEKMEMWRALHSKVESHLAFYDSEFGQSTSPAPAPATEPSPKSNVAAKSVDNALKLHPRSTDNQIAQARLGVNTSGGPTRRAAGRALPTTPPNGELYKTHSAGDVDVVAFIERVYGQRGYLTGEFTRADLRRIDPSAATALNNWEKGSKTRPKGRAPLNLPTVAERNDQRLMERPELTDPEAAREFERLRSAARRRAPK